MSAPIASTIVDYKYRLTSDAAGQRRKNGLRHFLSYDLPSIKIEIQKIHYNRLESSIKMDAIYHQLPDDIQSDVNAFYYKEVPFKEELKEFWYDFNYYQQTKKELGKGFIERQLDTDHPDWEDQRHFFHSLEWTRNRFHAKLLMKMDSPRPEEWKDKDPCERGAIYCYMNDAWDAEDAWDV